jgi:hypothetical protein
VIPTPRPPLVCRATSIGTLVSLRRGRQTIFERHFAPPILGRRTVASASCTEKHHRAAAFICRCQEPWTVNQSSDQLRLLETRDGPRIVYNHKTMLRRSVKLLWMRRTSLVTSSHLSPSSRMRIRHDDEIRRGLGSCRLEEVRVGWCCQTITKC